MQKLVERSQWCWFLAGFVLALIYVMALLLANEYKEVSNVEVCVDVIVFCGSCSRCDCGDYVSDDAMKREIHYKVENGYIVMWDGFNGYVPIAKVVNDLHCNIMVRTLQFAEECEECMDAPEPDPKMFRECFSRYVKDTMLEKAERDDLWSQR